MLTRELRPGDRLHLGGGVELHRARAERNHAAVQGNILVRQRAQVAHHRRFGAVLRERGVGQELRCARRRYRRSAGSVAGSDSEGVQHRSDVRAGGRLVAGHRHVVGVDPPQVDTLGLGRGQHLVGAPRHPGQHGVEVLVVHQRIAQRRRRWPRRGRAPAGRSGQPVGAVIARVHRGHHRQQHLRGADVAGRLVAADVLLAGLQRQPVGRATRRHPRKHRPAGRAADGHACACTPGTRRAGRRIPLAHRIFGWCRTRRRRRSRRAA